MSAAVRDASANPVAVIRMDGAQLGVVALCAASDARRQGF
jgi:uncharacterized protein GlcG (DUF336 family)